MNNNKRYCLFNLHTYCIVLDKVENPELPYGSVEFVKLYCAMCVKSAYAKAKHKLVNRYSVVNTL